MDNNGIQKNIRIRFGISTSTLKHKWPQIKISELVNKTFGLSFTVLLSEALFYNTISFDAIFVQARQKR